MGNLWCNSFPARLRDQDKTTEDWHDRENARAVEEQRYQNEMRIRYLTTKAVQDHPPSDTESEDDDYELSQTTAEQRDVCEKKASKALDRYGIRKLRLKFHHEGRLQLSPPEVEKLNFQIKCRSNEDTGKWDYTLLPTFRKLYESNILNSHTDAALIARRRERWEEERQRKAHWRGNARRKEGQDGCMSGNTANVHSSQHSQTEFSNTQKQSTNENCIIEHSQRELSDTLKQSTNENCVIEHSHTKLKQSTNENCFIEPISSEGAASNVNDSRQKHYVLDDHRSGQWNQPVEHKAKDGLHSNSVQKQAGKELENKSQYLAMAMEVDDVKRVSEIFDPCNTKAKDADVSEGEEAMMHVGMTKEFKSSSFAICEENPPFDEGLDNSTSGNDRKSLLPKEPKKSRKLFRNWWNPKKEKAIRLRIEEKQRLKKVSPWSIQDTEAYRMGYPNKPDVPNMHENEKFYFNKTPCKPDNAYIDVIHEQWKGDYKKLEEKHGYIQWIFPIREMGVNDKAYELQPHEAQAIMSNKEAHERVVRSYELMLDFYGLELVNRDDGTVARAGNWERRFEHLNKSFHNYLRITRILKCLGELGYEHYKEPFLRFILYEAIVEETLPNCARSCMEYWVNTVKDDGVRYRLLDEAYNLIGDSCKQLQEEVKNS